MPSNTPPRSGTNGVSSLFGDSLDNSLKGTGANNYIQGNGGRDTLDARASSGGNSLVGNSNKGSSLLGGTGSNLFYLYNANDTLVTQPSSHNAILTTLTAFGLGSGVSRIDSIGYGGTTPVSIVGNQASSLTINAAAAVAATLGDGGSARDLLIGSSKGKNLFLVNSLGYGADTIRGGSGSGTLMTGATLQDSAFGASYITGVQALNLTGNAEVTLGTLAGSAGISSVFSSSASLSPGVAVDVSADPQALRMIGGAGNDTFTLAPSQLSRNTISGGSGNLTVALSGRSTLSDSSFLTFNGVKALQLSANSSATLGAKASTSGISTVIAGQTGATVNAAAFSKGLTFSIAANGLAGDILRGSSLNDTLALSGPATLADSVFAGKSSLDLLSLTSPSSVTLGAAAGTAGISTVVTGSAPDTINASSYTKGLVFSVNPSGLAGDSIRGSAFRDTLALSGPSTLADSVFAGKNSLDILSITSPSSVTFASAAASAGLSTIVTGKGSDTIIANSFSRSLTLDASSASTTSVKYRGSERGDLILLRSAAIASSSLAGGSGSDTLAITDGKATLTSFANITKVDVLSLSGGGNIIANISSSVRTIKGGTLGGDSIDASAASASVLIDTSAATLGNTLVASKNAYSTLGGGSGDDLFVLNASQSTYNSVIGGVGSDTLAFLGAASLSASAFNGVSGIEYLSLAVGNNAVGSLQGSSIAYIKGNTGSDTMTANVFGNIKTKVDRGSSTISLTLPNGSATRTSGFAVGQIITGVGIDKGTTITALSTIAGGLTLTLSNPTATAITAGNSVTAWLNGITLDGSAGLGFPPTAADTLRAVTAFKNAASAITAANYGTPNELSSDTLAISTLRNDPSTYIHRKGDSLTAYGSGNSLVAGQGTNLPSLNLGGNLFDDQSSFSVVGGGSTLSSSSTAVGLSTLDGGPVVQNTPSLSFYQYQVVDNTLVSGAFASNTLVGGAGDNLYLINNLPNLPEGQLQLPSIINGSSLRSGSTIRLIGDGAILSDTVLASVEENTAQVIRTANGRNLVEIGSNAAAIGIQSIFGGNGSDTFTVPDDYALPVYLDASKNAVAGTSLSGGADSDTLLGGHGNSTLNGHDGNNSLIGGSGNNLITSGYGNSTLDSGIGVSTLQAAGGRNLMVIRTRQSRILIDPTAQDIPLEIDVNSYVNFDPIQSTELNQYAPAYPDGSPSITKSASFASSDLATFYTIRNFKLLGDLSTGIGAVYGVGNAMDNAMTQGVESLKQGQSNTSGALMLGMGGNNTLTSWGSNASLYGFSNESYASPDLYAAAPFDTRTQDFITNVMGTPGNNLLVANGGGSFLDGGPGYNNGSGTAAANTLIGTALNDTFVIRHQSDSVVAAADGSGKAVNTVYSTVDLNELPDNITDAVLVVTDQNQYLRNFSGNAPVLPSNSGQDAPATYLSYGNGHANSRVSHSVSDANVTFTVPNSSQMQVQYGTYALNHFQSDNVPTPDSQTRDQYFPLTVSDPLPDGNNPGMVAYQLDWNADLMQGADVVAGYTVLYRVQDDGSGQPGAWKTYVDGTSSDFQETTGNPVLIVDNLDAGFTYDFQVTAVQLQHPFTFDADGNEVATPVTLRGNSGNDVLWAFRGSQDSLGYGQNLGSSTWYANVNPVLGNNPASPLPAGTIPLTGPYSITHYDSPLYPVYLDGADGSNLLLSNEIGNGDGSSITIEAGTATNPQTLTYSGFNTLEGGKGSDTFLVANGTQNNFDLCIKYGNETPVDYTSTAPGVPSSLSAAGVSLNGGQHNMIASAISRIQLSDTTVSQGKFVDQLLLINGVQFGMGNGLDNFIYDVNVGFNTLVGNTGRDSILAQGAGGKDLLIGGTAALGDNIKKSMLGLYGSAYVATTPSYQTVPGADNSYAGQSGYYSINTVDGSLVYTPVTSSTPTLQGSSTVFSAYRDSDPVPATLQGGPGAADPSQYWFVAGSGNEDHLRNSDTLIANVSSTLDGGAGADSMLGSAGNDGNDWFVVSNGFSSSDHNNTTGTVYAGSGDVVVGNGGNDTICFSGSDLWWSGKNGYNTPLSYYLSNDGDAKGGQSVSNLVLQAGAPNAINAYGNNSSTGNQHKGNLGTAELGSNLILGNEFSNTLDGGGVGGTNGSGYGADTLTGGGGSDAFLVGSNKYRSSSQDQAATYTTAQSPTTPVVNTYSTSSDKAATDADYVTVTDFSTTGATDLLLLSGTSANYAIGSAPSSFSQHNIYGGTVVDPSHFGIYYVNGTATPNLVAEVTVSSPITIGSSFLSVAGQSVNGTSGGFGAASFAWTTGTASDLQSGGLNYLGFGAMYPVDSTSFAGFVQYS